MSRRSAQSGGAAAARSGGGYLSNGCAHCDALIGESFEYEAWLKQHALEEREVIVTEEWRAALEKRGQAFEGWLALVPGPWPEPAQG